MLVRLRQTRAGRKEWMKRTCSVTHGHMGTRTHMHTQASITSNGAITHTHTDTHTHTHSDTRTHKPASQSWGLLTSLTLTYILILSHTHTHTHPLLAHLSTDRSHVRGKRWQEAGAGPTWALALPTFSESRVGKQGSSRGKCEYTDPGRLRRTPGTPEEARGGAGS